jgi:hypothetical protein
MVTAFGHQLTQLWLSPSQMRLAPSRMRLGGHRSGRAPSLPELLYCIQVNLKPVGNLGLRQFTGLAGVHNPAPKIQG